MNEQPEPAVIHNDPGDWPSRRAGLRDELAAALYQRERPPREPQWPNVYASDREVFEAMADAVLTVLYREWPWLRAEAEDAWTPPPPGSTREQLPDHLLALLDIPPYTSTACETAELLSREMVKRTQQRIELGEHCDRLHSRCRRNQKFTGALCACFCHDGQAKPDSAATEATDTAICPHGCNVTHCPCPACDAERAAEEPTTRVAALYEQWVKAGPPPLGVPIARWWDRRLVELRDAIRADADEAPGEVDTEKARTQDLATSLYYAQDALDFVAERCDLADQQQRPVTTTEVRQWLKGARCARQLAAEQSVRTTGNNPPSSNNAKEN